MKLTLMLTKPLPEEYENLSRLYSPGHMFEVEVKELIVNSQDLNFNGMKLKAEDLKYFKLIGEA